MRVGLMAENPVESAILASGMVPTAMLEAYAPMYARAIVVATKVGMFDALAHGGRSAAEWRWIDRPEAFLGDGKVLDVRLMPRKSISLMPGGGFVLQVAERPPTARP